jgi:hypothetical protein
MDAALDLPPSIPAANDDYPTASFVDLPEAAVEDEDGSLAIVNKAWHMAFGYGSEVERLLPFVRAGPKGVTAVARWVEHAIVTLKVP